MKNISFHILFILTHSLLLFSQPLTFKGPDPKKNITQYTHEIWTTDNGLPQNSINAITQTNDGYIWMGTQEGLVRFDGVQFTVFDKNNTAAIRNNYISALYSDRKSGKLWIGSYLGGIIVYENGVFKRIDSLSKYIRSQIHSFYRDPLGGLWIATRENGAIRFDSVSVRQYTTANGLISNNVWKIYRDIQNRLWFATGEGVTIFNDSAFSSFSQKNGIASKEVYSLQQKHDSTIWLGTTKGLQRIKLVNSTITFLEHFTVDNGLPGNSIYALYPDQQGNLWIATNKGLARFYKNKFSSYTPEDGLSERVVNAIFIDREGNLWVGTEIGGLNVLKDGIFTSFTSKEGLPHNNAWTIFEDSKKNFWFGTDDGLVLFDRAAGTKKIYTKKNGLTHSNIWSLYEDKTGALWVGTISGLNKIVNEKIVPLPKSMQFTGEAISCIVEDSSGNIWLSTSGSGIHSIQNKSVKTLNSKNGIPSNYVNVIAFDRSNNLFIGMDGAGLAIYKDSLIKHFNNNNGFPANFVQEFYLDSSNTLWIGTLGNGLIVMRDSSFTQLTVKNGLFDDVVFRILEDNNQRLWISCNKGVYHINKSDVEYYITNKNKKIIPTVYGKENGMASAECNGGTHPAGWKASDGTLWFPTTRGITMVDPKKITINEQPPLVVIEDFLIDNQSVSLTESHIIQPGKQRYEFRYTGLSFDGPKKVRFKVKLEGYDIEWDEVANRRAAYYSHLPSGEYTFRVIAANSDGVWNMQGAEYSFVVQAHFYQTAIFYIFAVVSLLLIFFGIYRYRTSQIIRRQTELEQTIEDRTKDLTAEQQKTKLLLTEAEYQRELAQKANAMKTHLLDITAHDLRNPIIQIDSIAKEIIETGAISERDGTLMLMIRRATQRMILLISDLLNFSSIETGRLRFKFEETNVSELAAIILSGYELQAKKKSQSVILHANPEIQYTVLADPARLQEAFENLVSNAIKFSEYNSTIEIEIAKRNGIVQFSIKDSGPGFTEDDREKLFKKFQPLSAKPTGGEISTGLGLAIVKEIVDAHNGTITIHHGTHKGCVITIELPAAQTSH